MLRTTIVLAFMWAISAVAIADDIRAVDRAVDRGDIDAIDSTSGFLAEKLERRAGDSEIASGASVAAQADSSATDATPQPSRLRINDVIGDSYLNHLGIGFAMGLHESRIGPEFIFPNGKPGGSIFKPFTPVPGGDDGVIGDGGINPGGGALNPGEGPCFNCTVNPSPDD